MKTKNRNWLFLSIIIGSFLILTHSCKKDETPTDKITDKDGNIYTSVTIGTQVWMVENLKTTKFNDGTSIPNVTDNTAWIRLTTPGYCWYNNDVANKTPYGALYNWYAVNTGKLCPTGWHVPSDAEWTELTDYLGGESVAGGKLKETGTIHWDSPNTGATNETGFTALPGGGHDVDGTFGYVGEIGIWCSATAYNTYDAWGRFIGYSDSYLDRNHMGKEIGVSVRCLRD